MADLEAGELGDAQAGVEEGENDGAVAAGGGAGHAIGTAPVGGGGGGGGAGFEEGGDFVLVEGFDFFGGVAWAWKVGVGAGDVELGVGPGVEGADGFPGVFEG